MQSVYLQITKSFNLIALPPLHHVSGEVIHMHSLISVHAPNSRMYPGQATQIPKISRMEVQLAGNDPHLLAFAAT